MSYVVYILYSHKDRELYVGCTNNLIKRVEKHRNGHVLATKYRRPVSLIHYEKFDDKNEAFQRERFLKSFWGARDKKKILKKYMDELG